jgi:hypothetical protein
MPIIDPDVPKGVELPESCKFKEVKVGLFTRLLLCFWPRYGIRRLTKACGFLTPDTCWKLHDILASVGRVDIVPSKSGFRGFSIVFDNLFALYFNQDGDHFAYDGYEFGDYDNGDVTVFDK